MRLRSYPASAAAALALVLTACGSAAAGQHPGGPALTTSAGAHVSQDGVVAGRFQRVGGPIGAQGQQPAAVLLSGTVQFSRGRQRTDAHVGRSGRFSVALPAGSYRVRGRTPSIEEQLPSGHVRQTWCSAPVSVTVKAGRTEQIAVTCPVP
jgi:hypothetical protein